MPKIRTLHISSFSQSSKLQYKLAIDGLTGFSVSPFFFVPCYYKPLFAQIDKEGQEGRDYFTHAGLDAIWNKNLVNG